jgi:hypothetical protein
MKLSKPIFFCFVLVVSFYAQLTAQDTSDIEPSPKIITKEILSSKIKELEYDKMKTIYKQKEFQKKEKNSKENKPVISGDIGILGIFIKIVLYVGLAAFIIGIAYFLIKDYKQKQRQKLAYSGLDDDFDVEDIATLDIDALLAQTLKDGNYRLAMRLKFLKILQLLQSKKMIKWTKDKTNKSYVNELNVDHRYEFKPLVSIFDNVWYGHNELNLQQYQFIETKFDTFMKLLKK